MNICFHKNNNIPHRNVFQHQIHLGVNDILSLQSKFCVMPKALHSKCTFTKKVASIRILLGLCHHKA